MNSETIKSWTARRPVKILCVILIPILLFISSIGITGITGLDYANSELLFANLDKNDYFYDKYVYGALSYAEGLFWLQSEEHIRNMGCLEWEPVAFFSYPDEPPAPIYEYYDYEYELNYERPVVSGQIIAQYGLRSTNRTNQWYFGRINAEHMDSEESKQMVEGAIQQQLNEFIYAKSQLDGMPGLYYFVTDGYRWIGNTSPADDVDFYKSNPVYFVSKNGNTPELSRDDGIPYPYYLDRGYYGYYDADNISAYIAFTSEAVDWQNGVWRAAQRQLEIQLAMIAGPLVVAFALFIILLLGVGRRHGSESGTVSFMAIDKLWLDIGFTFVIGYEAALCYALYWALEAALRYDNVKWLTILFAAASVVLTLPALWWISSFVKRCKAGKFWRHTMCYAILRGIFNGVKKLLQSLWAGLRLTVKVVLIGLALLVGMIICFSFAMVRFPEMGLFLCFVFSALAVFLLLRYARKIHKIEQGAKAASYGRYDEPIAVTGGELGSIAVSINSISDGINYAVAERLKSERLKTELITNISHDIRTPLTSLITYTDLLKSEGTMKKRRNTWRYFRKNPRG